MMLLDINNIKQLPSVDLITAGFPCQPFSIAGKRLGIEDERAKVIFSMLDIIHNNKPKFIILENVKNFINTETFHFIIHDLREIGYNLQIFSLNTKDFTNLPQNRERLFILGSTIPDFNLDSPQPIIEQLGLSDILEDNVDIKYYYNNDLLNKFVTKPNTFYQLRRTYVRENKSGVCPTLTANMGTGGNNVPIIKTNNGIRKLTPRECARLQGLPDSFKLPLADTHSYKQIGNMVTVPLVLTLFKQLDKIINNER